MKKYLSLIIFMLMFVFIKTNAEASGGVGLSKTPYSISEVQLTMPGENEYKNLKYTDWQASNDFKDIYQNGYYIIRVRDALDNINYYPVKVEGLIETFEVDFVDLADDKSVLGTQTKYIKVGTVISGSELGADASLGKYYPGHTYESCTGTTVSPFEKNLVYRNFKAKMLNITYHSLNGEVFGSESIRYGSNTAFSSEPIKETVSTDSETLVYRFKGWADKNGNIVSLASVTDDLDLYPVYDEERYPNEMTIAFHYLDEKDTIIYVSGRRGEIEAPEPTKEDTVTEEGRTWYSFEYWTTADGSRVFDFSKLTSTDLYACYAEEFVPNYVKPEEEEKELPDTPIEEIELQPDLKKEEIVFIGGNEESAKGFIPLNTLIENKEPIGAVATISLLAILTSILLNLLIGAGVIQSVIFLWALIKKKKRYVSGVWLLGTQGIKYVDKFGREVFVKEDDKGYQFETQKGKALYGVDVKKELRRLQACRITQKEFMRIIKESEVYTVFNKDVRIEFGNSKNTNKALGFNLFSGIKDISENLNHYSMKLINGSKEIIYDIKTAEA